MAAKKQQNRVTSDTSGKKAGGRSSAHSTRSRTSGNANSHRGGRQQRRVNPEPEPEEEGLVRWELIVLGSFAAAVILFLSNFHLCGIAGNFLRSVQLGLFGLPGYIAPLALFIGICIYQANRGSRLAVQRIIASVAAFFLLCGFSQMIFGQQPEEGTGIFEYYRLSAVSGMGGGLAGGFLFGLVRSLIGGIGAFLFMAVGLILCMVCITRRSFVKAVKRHSDVAYQYAREDMERRRELYSKRQEERKQLRKEQRVRGVNLGSTKLLSSENEYQDDGLEDTFEDGYYENDADDYDDYENRSAAVYDQDVRESYEDDSVRETARGRRKSPSEAFEPDFEAMQTERSYAEIPVNRGAELSRSEPSRFDPTGKFPANNPIQEEYHDTFPEPEDDYDLEAAAKRLTQSGFGQFEQTGEVFTGGARRLDQKSEKKASYSLQADQKNMQDVAPWDEPEPQISFDTKDQEGSENPYMQEDLHAETQNPYMQEDLHAETQNPYMQEDLHAETQNPYMQEDLRAETENPYIQEQFQKEQDSGTYAQDTSAVYDRQPEQEPVWQESDSQENDSDTDVAYTVKTEQNTDFAILEESKRVVTAGGKVIETDTEALQKKLESAKKAEADRKAEEAEKETPGYQIREREEKPMPAYVKPPLSLLKQGTRSVSGFSNQEQQKTAMKLEQTLRNFGVGVTVTNISCGPSVTRYELHPEQGVKVSKIVSLADDIKLSLAAEDIRIEAPIPGKSAVGIEVPNKEKTSVFLRDLLESDSFQKHPSNLAFAVGKDIGGQVVVTDIAKMPHLLIAGATGSGKSVCINTIIMSIIYKAHPDDVKLIMVDPKVVELSVYNGIPHLMMDVVTDPKKASAALNWAVEEMTRRYKLFAKYGVRDLKGYNVKIQSIQDIEDENKPIKMSQIVIIVDELADLMMVAPGEVEDAICRLAQLARAAGIHLVIATQRPSVNVITGLIKANVPSRIAFSVSSGVDSRTIIDMNGAEKLLGKGDMLFYPAGFPKPQRVQGAFVSDGEVQQVVDFLTEQGFKSFNTPDVENSMNLAPSASASGSGNSRDEYFEQAGRFIIEKEKASIGMLQRMFKIGFNRAARIMDQLAEAGVVGEEEGTKPRKVLMTMEEFDQII